jgi:hypothetical protein
MLAEHGCEGARLGLELEAYGLTGVSLCLVDEVAPASGAAHAACVDALAVCLEALRRV